MYDPMVESYKRFCENTGHFPKMFNAYNCQEVTDIAPTVTTSCGSWFCSATVSILVEDKNESANSRSSSKSG
jgi:hypothetical protein